MSSTRVGSTLSRVRARIGFEREVRAGVHKARRVSLRDPAAVRVCWDLDNTLVDSGSLLRQGMQLDDAITAAYPLPNMLAFYSAMHLALPAAGHFVLSARGPLRLPMTIEWLERYSVKYSADYVCLVSSADAKPQIWAELARDARLVIVDDLSFNHELDEPSLHQDLVHAAAGTASCYVGLDDIRAIGEDSRAIASVVARVATAVSP